MCSPATTYSAFGSKAVNGQFVDSDFGTATVTVVSGLSIATGSGVNHSGGPASISSIDVHLSTQGGLDVLGFSSLVDVNWSDRSYQMLFGGSPDSAFGNSGGTAPSSGNIYQGSFASGFTDYGTYSFSGQDLQISFTSPISDTELIGSILESVFFQNTANFRLGYSQTISWSFGTTSGTASAPNTVIAVSQQLPLPPGAGINAIAGDNTINKAEANGTGGIPVGGFTTADGDGFITVNILDSHNNIVITRTPFSDGTWGFSLTNAEAQSLADGTYTVQVTDPSVHGLGVSATVTRTLTVDETPPSISISAVAGDDVVSADEAAASVAIGGNTTGAEDGRTVTVKVLDSSNHVQATLTTSVSGGAWSVSLSSAQLHALTSGNYMVTADVSDLAGNPATTATRPFSFEPPPVVVTETATLTSGGGVSGTGALTGDHDPSGYGLAVSAITGGALDAPVHGSYGDLTLHADGSFSYLANATAGERANVAAATGQIVDSFSFSVSNGHGGVSPATLNVDLDATKPTISAVGFSPASGTLTPTAHVAITLTMSEAVVFDTSGGAPTLALNDGGVATFDAADSTPTALVFGYDVLASDSTIAALAANRIDLNGAVIRNASDVADASLSFAGLAQSGPPIDTTPAAGTFIWGPDPSSGPAHRFEISANWLGGTVPGAFDTAVFGNTAVTSVFMQGLPGTGGSESIDSLQFTADAPAYSLSWNVQSLGFGSFTPQILILGAHGGQDIDNESSNLVSFSVVAPPTGSTPELLFKGAGIKGAVDLSLAYGTIAGFSNASTAGNATITVDGSLSFEDTSTAGQARLIAETTANPLGGTFAGQVTFDVAAATAGSIEGAGQFHLGSAQLTVGGNDRSTEVSGSIDGSGSLVKVGGGTLTLSGTDTYNGSTAVDGGTLEVDGALTGSPITVNSGGTLDGHGTSGAITVASGGTLAPGVGIGVLHSGDVAFASGAHFAVALASTAQFDQLDVTGTVSLGGASLDLSLLGYLPHAPDGFVIIKNDGTDAVSGQFAQGTSFTFGGKAYTINYAGGDGNDVVLSVADIAPTLGGDHAIALAAGGSVTVTTTDLTATDPDNTDAQIVYTLAVASHGTVLLNGSALSAGQSFTQADLAASHLSFQQDGSTGTEAGFTVSVTDGLAPAQFATVVAAVTQPDHAPVAQDNSASGSEDGIIFAALGATDSHGDALTYTRVGQPAHGSVAVLANGAFVYTPNANYSGTDSFTFKANDGSADSNVATETLVIAAVDDPPVAQNGTASGNENAAITGTVTATDVDSTTLTYGLVQQAAHGMVTVNAGGTFAYTPNAGYVGPDSFTFKANDGTSDSNVASISLTINAVNAPPVNVAPVAQDGAAGGSENGIIFAALGATDGNGDALTYTRVGQPTHGSVTVLANGAFVYTPDAGYHGTDSFTFKANDGALDSNIATETLTVSFVDHPPAAQAGSASGNENATIAGSLAASDIDGQVLTYSTVGQAAHGTVTVNPNGTFSYMPDANYHGADSFTFKANDGALDSNVATETLSVNFVDHAPEAQNGAAGGSENTTITGALSASDLDGDALTDRVIGQAANGHVTINPDGTFSYTPNANYHGADSFTFEANDGTLDSNSATESLTVGAASHGPVQNDFNGSGHSSLLWQNSDGTAAVWSVDGTALVSGANVGFNPGASWHAIGAGDFNADGKADILWQNDSGQAAVWLMNGSNILSGANAGFNPGAAWHVIGSGDFDGDGKADILWQNQNGQAAVWLMDGTTVKSGANAGPNPGADWHVIGTGDFDGDGKADILWQNKSGQAAVWLMDGTTVKAAANVGFNPGADWHVQAAGDFNGDGKADILWQNANGQAAIWEMNGLTVLSGANVGFNPGPAWQVHGTGDFNGDGKADIEWQNTDGTAAVWLMDGTNVVSGGNIGFDPGAAWHVVPQHHDALV